MDNDLLTQKGTITLPAVERKQVEIVSELKRLGLRYWPTITEWFVGMLVDSHPGSNLAYHTLNRKAYDTEIIPALGGEKIVETKWEDFLSLVNRQLAGEQVFLADGRANVFYIRDKSLVLCAVWIRWFNAQWHVHAYVLGISNWFGLQRFFSRNS